MPNRLQEDLKEEIIRLRTQENLSLREIHKLTRVSKGTLSSLLKPYPLPEAIRQHKQAVAYSKLIERNASSLRKYKPPTESKFYQVVQDKQLSSSQKGAISEAAILFRLVLHGFRVYGSPFDGGSTDWLVENHARKLLRLQVKTVHFGSNNAPRINNRCSDGRKRFRLYKEVEYDFLIGYSLKTDIAYVFSVEDLQGRQDITCLDKDAERWDKLL